MVSKLLDSDFKYDKYICTTPIIMEGPLGRTNIIMEVGKLWNRSGLMSVIPGNQTFFILENSNLNFYEFVAISMLLCSGITIRSRLFSRIPFMRKLNWRELCL
jgi:hypothetical protein